MQCKLYKDLQDIPLWNYSGDDQPAPTLEPDEGEDDVEEDVAEEIADAKEADVKVADAVGKNMKADDTKAQVNAKDEISKMRLSCKHILCVSTKILCRDGLQQLVRIVMTMVKPVRTEHAANARNCRGTDGCREYYISAAKGKVF